ncbi:MAG: Trm112 family protein, partial [Armatimonadota bacterium]
MKEWQLKLLACPFEHAPLRLDGERLICQSCGRIFPIIEGIPSFVIQDLAQVHDEHEWQWKQSEMKARNEQAVFYDRLLGLFFLTPFEVPMTIKALLGDQKRFDKLIEVGCGT